MGLLNLELEFQFKSAFHTTGNRLALEVDRALYLHPVEDKPAIPATSIKGMLRRQAEIVLRALGKQVCIPPRPEDLCDTCLVCRLFGSPRTKSPLIFEDAILDGGVSQRAGVGIGRRRKTAREDPLMFSEIAYAPKARLRIYGIFQTKEDAILASSLLYVASKHSLALGSSMSRGLGWIELEHVEITFDGSEVSLRDVEDKVKELMKNE